MRAPLVLWSIFSFMLFADGFSGLNQRGCSVIIDKKPSGNFSVKIPFYENVKKGKNHLRVSEAFRLMVDSTEFMTNLSVDEDINSKVLGCASIPLFGNDVCMLVELSNSSCIEISLNGSNISRDDFGWICAKFYESKEAFENVGLNTFNLRRIVADHFNSQPPHPGYDADRTCNDELVKSVFYDEYHRKSAMKELSSRGYTVIDNVFPVTNDEREKFQELLVEKTCQGEAVRTDKVSFISREDATYCGLKTQFDLLMAMASFLNTIFFIPVDYKNKPIPPATAEKPLTNPLTVQAAEYQCGDFYVEHSDNSLDSDGAVRANFRHITCIYYLNENWEYKEDGGSLRIYPGSSNLFSSSEAKHKCRYVDINPINGRLLLFDSKLYHSVQEVKKYKSRLALTLWITKPDDSDVRGERWDEGLPN